MKVFMDFFEVINKRRSTRRFTDDPVSDDDLRSMLDAARLAPSSHNQQPWHFIVIRDSELITDIKDIVDAALTAQIDLADSEERKKTLKGRRFFAVNVFDAPVVIVALTRPWPNPSPQEQPVFNQGLQSVAAAIAQLHLAATALGYGGCWATLPVEMAGEEIETILGVEPPWFVVSMLSIGVPAKTPRDIPRKSIEEIVTFK